MKTIFLATVPPPPARDKYDFASLRDYGMAVAASVRDHYQGRIAELEAERDALKAICVRTTHVIDAIKRAGWVTSPTYLEEMSSLRADINATKGE